MHTHFEGSKGASSTVHHVADGSFSTVQHVKTSSGGLRILQLDNMPLATGDRKSIRWADVRIPNPGAEETGRRIRFQGITVRIIYCLHIQCVYTCNGCHILKRGRTSTYVSRLYRNPVIMRRKNHTC